MRLRYGLLVIAFCMVIPVQAQEQEVTLSASIDNTMYDAAAGDVSNGAGAFLFAGRTTPGDFRRGLVAFDLSPIPGGSTILSAELALTMSKIATDMTTISLIRVLEQWGEGPSDASGPEGAGTVAQAGDATWLHREFPGEQWSTPGGSISPTASAMTTVAALGRYTWSSDELTGDVQGWVDDPSANFGWLIQGDESKARTATRFGSRENPEVASRPALIVRYSGTATSIQDQGVPSVAVLAQNHPNPFTTGTTIEYSVPASQEVSLRVFDLLGRHVATLDAGRRQAGRHRVQVDATSLPNGVYLYRLETGGSAFTRQFVVLK